MDWIQALILGLVQGLTEYLPVSSSGHLTILSNFFGIDGADNLQFTVAVHVATVLSTLVILWKEIDWILKGLFKFKMNDETKYALNIVVSMIPVGIVGVFFKDKVEEAFGAGLLIVGVMLCVTSVLLIFSYYAKPRVKEHISLKDAFVIGLAQACAVLPGLSRSLLLFYVFEMWAGRLEFVTLLALIVQIVVSATPSGLVGRVHARNVERARKQRDER